MRPLSPLGEVAAYAGLFLLALGLRLGGLEGRPLAPKEAEVAYAAWRLVEGAPLASTPPPLALGITTASFFLLGASDLMARLGSIVGGSLVVPALALFRPQLGFWGALGAAALAAISPTLILSSRFLSSVPAALLLSVIGAGLLLRLSRSAEEPAQRPEVTFWALSVLAGLLLNGGVLGLGFVLVGILFVGLQAGRHPGTLSFSGRYWILAFGVLLATFYGTATTLTVNWPGVGLASLGEWNDALAGDGLGGGGGALLWATYEPLTLFLGLWGLGRWVKGWRGGSATLTGLDGLLALWTGAALILMVAGRVSAFAPFLGLPLILWGGPVLASWIARLRTLRWGSEWGYYLLAAVGLVLSLLVANWLTLPGNVPPLHYWLLVLIGLAPVLVTIGLLVRGRLASSPALALGLAILLALTAHSGSALNYGEAAAEPLIAEAAQLDVKDALGEVVRRAGRPYWWTGAEVQLDQTAAQPWLWYLREYSHLLLVEEAQGSPAVAITAPGKGGALQGYRGNRGWLWVQGQGPEGGAGAWWRWFAFRQPAGTPAVGEFEILFRE